MTLATDVDFDEALAARCAEDPELAHATVEHLKSLPPDQARAALAKWQAAMRRERDRRWKDSPASMMERLGKWKRWPYVDLLSQKFVDAYEGRSPRQIWNLPSRYGKTLIAKWAMVWVLDQTDGKAKMILVSYGYELARESTTEVRDLMLLHGDVLRGQLRPDLRRQDRFVTENGGGLMAAGIDGSIIGFGAGNGGGIFVDDPLKNWQEAHSEARRQHVAQQFRGVVRNRLDQEAAWIIVIHHRMHERDLTGELLDDTANDTGDSWEHVCLPALAYEPGDDVPPDPLGREPGEPLEPERYSLDDVLSRAKGMGSYLSSAMEQQRPVAEKGNEILREWFHLATASELPTKPERAISSWDLKLKDREEGDYVVGQAWWAIGPGRWCMDQIRGQYDHATTQNAIALMAVRHPEIKAHHVEAAGSADEVVPAVQRPQQNYVVTDEMAARLGMTPAEREAVQRLRRAGMGSAVKTAAVTQAAKPVRARVYIAPAAEAGYVRVPAEAPWVPTLLDEIAAFPRGVNDDQVDAMSQALKILRPRAAAGAASVEGAIPR